MTEEERKDAERLASQTFIDGGTEWQNEAFTLGYAAACEDKRAEMAETRWDNLKKVCRNINLAMRKDLEAERARSAKLIEALKWYASQNIDGNDGDEPCNLSDRAKLAIAEYEASK